MKLIIGILALDIALYKSCDLYSGQIRTLVAMATYCFHRLIIMPPTLKKLMGHIAFGASVGGCVGGWVTLFVPTVTFKPLKLES